MSRLADYFVVVGYDFDKDKNGFSTGKIIQKFPTIDWEDTPFNEGIELFCQPQGWSLTSAQQMASNKDLSVPTFFVSVLTDIDAERHYCACLTFREAIHKPRQIVQNGDSQLPLMQQFDTDRFNDSTSRPKVDHLSVNPDRHPFQNGDETRSIPRNQSKRPVSNCTVDYSSPDQSLSEASFWSNCASSPNPRRRPESHPNPSPPSSYHSAVENLSNPLRTPETEKTDPSYEHRKKSPSKPPSHDFCHDVRNNNNSGIGSQDSTAKTKCTVGSNCESWLPTVTKTLPHKSSAHSHVLSYAPKCLVLVSRLPYFETFRNCLGYVYTTYLQNPKDVRLEKLIGNLLGTVKIPLAGSPQFTFSLGVGDIQIVQPPLSPILPISGDVVSTLFKQLGIHNSLLLVNACLTDSKILLHSHSYQRLTDACNALSVLLFPLKYNNVYIPILPAALMEILNAPTPFLMGIHSALLTDISEFYDIIIADMDAGSLTIPENVNVPLMPKYLYQSTLNSLSLIMNPDLEYADQAFPKEYSSPSPPSLLDKEIRAIFLRLFAHLLLGYRSCLIVSRIIPSPNITFHKYKFMGARNFVDNEFVCKIFDSMSFNSFITERGLPYRPLDLFDEVYDNIGTLLKNEEGADKEILKKHIRYLALQLSYNECPSSLINERLTRPPPGINEMPCTEPFPLLIPETVEEIIAENRNDSATRPLLAPAALKKKNVPTGEDICHSLFRMEIAGSKRRFDTFKSCIDNIFENRITDARKAFPSTLRMLVSKAARLTLCQELTRHVRNNNRAILGSQQFYMIIQLMNTALQNETVNDQNGIAAALLPLSTIFCQKLCTGVIQFAYTCIQNHTVWSNLAFWETSFFGDVEKQLISLYQSHPTEPTNAFYSVLDNNTPNDINRKKGIDIACEQLRKMESTTSVASPNQAPSSAELHFKELAVMEEATVYSLATHYINQLVYLRLPLECNGYSQTISRHASYNGPPSHPPMNGISHRPNLVNESDDKKWTGPSKLDSITTSSPSIVTTSIGGSESLDNESGFEEDMVDVTSNVTRFASRFIDKVCTELGVTKEHMESLNQMVSGLISMHMETLETVYREIQRLPPIIKPKILTPYLLVGEEIIIDGLRTHLVSNGYGSGGPLCAGPKFFPSEGCIYVTNYRIIYKGVPRDALACESNVVKSFPIASLIKAKRIELVGMVTTPASDIPLSSAIQLRSSTFQVMNIAFDADIPLRNIEYFHKLIKSLRYPENLFSTYALSFNTTTVKTLNSKVKKTKAQTLKSFAKKTLFISKSGSRHNKNMPHSHHTTVPNSSSATLPALVPSPHHGIAAAAATSSTNQLVKGGKPNNSRRPHPPPNRADYPTVEDTYNDNDQGDSNHDLRAFNDDVDVMDHDGRDDDLHSDEDLSTNLANLSNCRDGYIGNVMTNSVEKGHTFTSSSINLAALKNIYGPGLYLADFQRTRLLHPSKDLDEVILDSTNLINEPTYQSSHRHNQIYNLSSNNPYSPTSSNMNTDFRISTINSSYSLCRSYPAYLLCPRIISDEDFRKISRAYKHSRLPITVWRHPLKKSLLLRSGGFNVRNLLRIIKSRHASPILNDAKISTYLLEQQKYISALIDSSYPSPKDSPPSSCSRMYKGSNRGSYISLASSSIAADNSYHTKKRGGALQRAFANIKAHSGKWNSNHPNNGTFNGNATASSPFIGSCRPNNSRSSLEDAQLLYKGLRTSTRTSSKIFDLTVPPTLTTSSSSSTIPFPPATTDGSDVGDSAINNDTSLSGPSSSSTHYTNTQRFDPNHKLASLYFVGEKSQVKNIRIDSLHNFTFVPYEFCDYQSVKMSFKKLMEVCQLLDKGDPSDFATNTESVVARSNLSSKRAITKSPGTMTKSGTFDSTSVTSLNPGVTYGLVKSGKNYLSTSYNVKKLSTNLTNLVINPTLMINKTTTDDRLRHTSHPYYTKSHSSRVNSSNYFSHLEACGWYQQLHNIFKISGLIVDIIDVIGASVIVGLEDGWDITAQVVSLVEILLDPYYRTFKGFRALVEKEWIAFGHKFTQRLAMTAMFQEQGFTPIFLQFLDAVHQLQIQFPLSFEFNQYYLKYIAFHHCSQRFYTFMGDCEVERRDILRNFNLCKSNDNKDPTTQAGTLHELCLWDEIGRFNEMNPTLFRNWSYMPHEDLDQSSFLYNDSMVLRPMVTGMADLHIWSYYTEEYLGHGSPYDQEILYKELPLTATTTACSYGLKGALPPGTVSLEGNISNNRQSRYKMSRRKRLVMNPFYQDVGNYMPLRISWLTKEMERLESLLGTSLPKSHVLPTELRSSYNVNGIGVGRKVGANPIRFPFNSHEWVRQARLIKDFTRSTTIDILRSKKMSRLGDSLVASQQPAEPYSPLLPNTPTQILPSINGTDQSGHIFERHKFSSPAYCDICSGLLWDVIRSGSRCKYCDHQCHDKCRLILDTLPPSTSQFKTCPRTFCRRQSHPTDPDPTGNGNRMAMAIRDQVLVTENTLISNSSSANSDAKGADVQTTVGSENGPGQEEVMLFNARDYMLSDVGPLYHSLEGLDDSIRDYVNNGGDVSYNFGDGTNGRSLSDTSSVNTSGISTLRTRIQMFDQYFSSKSSSVGENKTYEGFLYKRGALFKGWKQRWFVLDSIRHQLRYYDSCDDVNCKGWVDLKEVIAVYPATVNLPNGGPKNLTENAYFDVKTLKRIYNFIAFDEYSAREWIEKIQSCLQ